MSDETKTGVPTVEQVRAHAEQYPVRGAENAGRWLWRMAEAVDVWGHAPLLVLLRAHDGRVEAYDVPTGIWRAPSSYRFMGYTPCDQQGNPVGLVEELKATRAQVSHRSKLVYELASYRNTARAQLEEAQRTIAELRERVEQDERECTQLREANDTMAKRLAAAQARIGRLETDLALLGGSDTPEGKALRALVRAARPHIADAQEEVGTVSDMLFVPQMIAAHIERPWELGLGAACLAVLLARRGQGTEPAATDEPPCRACGGVGSVPRTLPDQGRHPCGLCFHQKEDGEPERRTCGACNNCRTVHSRRSMAICRHHRVMNAEREVIPMDAPPGWCPGFDPRD